MRPSSVLLFILIAFTLVDSALLIRGSSNVKAQYFLQVSQMVTASLGLSDLCLSTEARYTRHLSVTDAVAPFMDHPGALEHFPSGSFYGVSQ